MCAWLSGGQLEREADRRQLYSFVDIARFAAPVNSAWRSSAGVVMPSVRMNHLQIAELCDTPGVFKNQESSIRVSPSRSVARSTAPRCALNPESAMSPQHGAFLLPVPEQRLRRKGKAPSGFARGNAEQLGFRRWLHDVEGERIAAFRLAARADQ